MKHNFKVGDRVRIRGTSYKGVIARDTQLSNPGFMEVVLDGGYVGSIRHYETLIRLKKKEKMRVWVNEYTTLDVRDYDYYETKELADENASTNRIRCLRFVLEGIEDE